MSVSSSTSSTSSGSGARCLAREAAAEPAGARFHFTNPSSAVCSPVLTLAVAAPPRLPAAAPGTRAPALHLAVTTAAVLDRHDARDSYLARAGITTASDFAKLVAETQAADPGAVQLITEASHDDKRGELPGGFSTRPYVGRKGADEADTAGAERRTWRRAPEVGGTTAPQRQVRRPARLE